MKKTFFFANASSEKMEKFNKGDVVVQIGSNDMWKLGNVAHGYVHLTSEDKWITVPINMFIENWVLVDKGD